MLVIKFEDELSMLIAESLTSKTVTVGAECGGALALPNQSVGSGGFGGLFACVLGGDTRQGRPASWDTLIVALVKLMCVFIQTPLPGVCISFIIVCIYICVIKLSTFVI